MNSTASFTACYEHERTCLVIITNNKDLNPSIERSNSSIYPSNQLITPSLAISLVDISFLHGTVKFYFFRRLFLDWLYGVKEWKERWRSLLLVLPVLWNLLQFVVLLNSPTTGQRRVLFWLLFTLFRWSCESLFFLKRGHTLWHYYCEALFLFGVNDYVNTNCLQIILSSCFLSRETKFGEGTYVYSNCVQDNFLLLTSDVPEGVRDFYRSQWWHHFISFHQLII